MADSIEYKCPSCSGAIAFDSNLQQMKCPYCDNTYDVETLKAYDEALKKKSNEEYNWEDYNKDSGNGDWTENEKTGIRTYICSSCGGEVVGDANTAVTKCPYCDNVVVMSEQFAEMLRPDYVIPFKLDKNHAMEALKNHMKGKILLPKSFKDKNRIEEIKGMYVPFWLFDADVDADIHYRAKNVTRWSDSKYNYVKTSYYQVERAGNVSFERVPVDGSSKIDDTVMESIEPFNYAEAVDFQTAYLAGYFADKYDVDANTSVPRANTRIKNSTVDLFGETVVGYDSKTVENVLINTAQKKITYALFPVWFLNTKYLDKTYTFAMNGQTGKFVGDLPMDKKAFWLWFFGLFAGVTALVFLIMLFM